MRQTIGTDIDSKIDNVADDDDELVNEVSLTLYFFRAQSEQHGIVQLRSRRETPRRRRSPCSKSRRSVVVVCCLSVLVE
jgi:hypothetical protein